ncbi:hypothetical protein Fcan01_22682 [Folsomia candida]|uniref:Uncharacterized protein n=1 Tax=Folsomia candida TaxID=158441 RepID=A0A226DA95_FOLCA|nr:hypothetical protein Fcan01_22682 [Folsomia candida]
MHKISNRYWDLYDLYMHRRSQRAVKLNNYSEPVTFLNFARLNVNLVFLKYLVEPSNVSIGIKPLGNKTHPKKRFYPREWILEKNHSNYYYKSALPFYEEPNYFSRFGIFAESSYKFVTCDGIKEYSKSLGWKHFTSSYDIVTWIFILFSCFVLIILFAVRSYKLGDLILPFFNSLLGQGDNFWELDRGNDNTEIRTRNRLKILVTLTWIISLLVLTNAYKGSNITDLTFPYPPTLFTKFEELVQLNFTFYGKPYNEYFFAEVDKPKTKLTNNLLIGRYTNFGWWEVYKKTYEREALKNNTQLMLAYSIDKLLRVPPSIQEIILGENKTYASDLVGCRRTAFIGREDEADEVYHLLKSSSKETFAPDVVLKGKQGIANAMRGFSLKDWENPAILDRIR